ncbi:Tubby c-terminal-like domain [Globisporangium polare]
MGMGQSSVQQLPHDDSVRLVPQSRSIAAVGVRYCSSSNSFDAPVALEITHQSTLKPSRFVARDPTTGVVRFHKERKLLSTRQTLVDVCDKVPVLNAKKSAFSSDFSVRLGADDATPELLQMYAKVGFDRADLRVSFANLTTGERCLMGMQGNWRLHQGSFWLKRGSAGVREPIAKVRPSADRLKGTEVYTLEVAQNVDVALILAICMVLDERWRRLKSRNDL